jgi:cytidyltransferase-like protein
MTNNFDVAVLIGRFQPFHQGHASLLALALSNADKVIVVLGSAFCARSVRNPFTWQERAAMISASLSEADQARVSFIPVRDYYDDLRWANAVQNKVTQAIAGRGDEALHIALIGYVRCIQLLSAALPAMAMDRGRAGCRNRCNTDTATAVCSKGYAGNIGYGRSVSAIVCTAFYQ